MFEKLKPDKNRKVSSTKWLQRRLSDPFVHQAKFDGYRSRAAFKLLQIEEKYHFIRQCRSCIVDLGSAPGSWLQILHNTTKPSVSLVGVDLQEISPLPRAQILVGDFTESDTMVRLEKMIDGKEVDLVLSDMAPSSCGDRETDHLRVVNLIDDALIFAERILRQKGNFLAKIWHGGAEQELRCKMRTIFTKVELFKPEASYSDSSEIFLIGIDRR